MGTMHLYLDNVLDDSGSMGGLGVGHMLYAAKPITAFGRVSSSQSTNASMRTGPGLHTTQKALSTCRGPLGISDRVRGSGILARSGLLLPRPPQCQKIMSRW